MMMKRWLPLINPTALKQVGIQFVKEGTNGNYICHCPFHMDIHPSFSIHENGLWLCFSCGRKGNLETLSCYLNVVFPHEFLVDMAELQRKLKPKEVMDLDLKTRLYQETYDHKYLEERGISLETAKIFSTGYDRLAECVVFPIFESNKPIAIIKRSIHTKKYKIFGEKSKSFFGQQFLNEDKPIIIVEGPIDCMKAYELGYENVVAVAGRMISEKQIHTITKYPKVILAFDNDEAGHDANKYYGGLLMKMMPVFVLEYDKKDFGDSEAFLISNFLRYRYHV